MTSCSAEARELPWRALKVGALVLLGIAAVLVVGLVGYERSLARVREHRAALERLVRSYTGLDVRFSELGLRWGWYGPEAVFRQVELDVPADPVPLLRAPALIVSLDLWSTLRSGDLAAGRITLLSPDIDLAPQGGMSTPPCRCRAAPATPRLGVLTRWHGGRIDIEGGTLEVPDPGAEPVSLQIRSASLRHSGEDWRVSGLLFLPERLGHAARVGLELHGDLGKPASLNGTVRLEGYQLRFAGWRDTVRRVPGLDHDLPLAGDGDIQVAAELAGGQVARLSGEAHIVGLALGALQPHEAGVLALDHLRGTWQLERNPAGWHLEVDGLELGEPDEEPAHLELQASPQADRVSARLQGAPLAPVMDIARWLAPHLQLGRAEIEGTVRDLSLDWDRARQKGRTVEVRGALDDVSISPPSRAFTLGGLSVRVRGSEGDLLASGGSRAARLELAHAPAHPLAVGVDSELRIRQTARGWEVTASRLDLRHEHTVLALKGTLAGVLTGRAPMVTAHGTLTGADVVLLKQLFGASTSRAFGPAASQLTAGRIEDAEISLRGPLDERLLSSVDPAGFTGSLTLRDGVLSGGDLWPDATDVNARIDWRGASIEALLESGHAGAFQLDSGEAQWDALGRHPTHVTGQVQGRLQDAMAWLRAHPALQAYAPRVEALALKGQTLLDLDVRLPAGGGATQTQVVAHIDEGQLEPAAGLPPIGALHGTLTLRDGRLQRSVLDGSWLGGPARLRFSQHSERGTPVIAVQGHGWLDAGELTFPAAAIGASAAPPLQGTSEWSGDLSVLVPHGSRPMRWRAAADLSLTDVASELPAPLGKPSGTPVPLHVEAQGTGSQATLRVALGDRLRSIVALASSGSSWSIERGDLRLGTTAAVLPGEPVLQVTGHTRRLELAPYLFLWQQLRHGPGAPALLARVQASELEIAGHSYPQVHLQAEPGPQGEQLQLASADMEGTATWPFDGTAARLSFSRLTVPEVASAGSGVAVLAALGPAATVSIGDLIFRGHSLGKLSASLKTDPASLAVEDLTLASPTQQGQGTLRCDSAGCDLSFALDTTDVAGTLARFGYRPDLTAERGSLAGEVQWPLDDDPPLAHMKGTVHLSLEDGTTHAGGEAGSPFPLLSVPAVVVALSARPHADPTPLRFSQLAGDFELRDGEALTSNLHFDGDAEILMQGRAGLLTRDYDQQVWILRGEERLPALVRRLGPTQRVAAIWLSLRGLFAPHADRAPAVLHLQGTWDDPIVVPEASRAH